MMRSRRPIAVLLLVCALGGCSTHRTARLPGDGPPRPAEGPGDPVVREGQKVRIETVDGDRLAGVVAVVSGDTLYLDKGVGEIGVEQTPRSRTDLVAVPGDRVRSLEVARTNVAASVLIAAGFAAFIYMVSNPSIKTDVEMEGSIAPLQASSVSSPDAK